MGTGGLVIGERVDMAHFEPLIRGGTGSRSEHEYQPGFLPDALESGTPNVVGLAGLRAGAQWLIEKGVDNIRRREIALTRRAIDGLRGIDGVRVYGGLDAARQTATVSFTMPLLSPSDAALRLDEQYGVLCRPGLHCSPSTHKTIGTFPQGTIRFSMAALTTEAQLDAALDAVATLSSGARR
jgi:selenocysteine lyase/cysteine desulfurase